MSTTIYEINRKHTLNQTFFDTIDTEAKAYLLGLLWADGSLSKTAKRYSGNNRLSISQKIDDIDQLHKIQMALNSNYSLYMSTTNNAYSKNHKIATLSINSVYLVNQLECLGMCNKESRTSIPKMPNNLTHHFIRGYFDGDGCLSVYQQKIKKWNINKQEFSLTGNEQLLLAIKQILEDSANVSNKIKLKRYKRTNKAVSLRYGKKQDIISLHQYLYKNATIYNENKHQKFVDFQNRLNGCKSDAL